MIKILHITAHLGGGVGRVISNVAIYRRKIHSEIEEIIVCLEAPHKEQVIATLRNAGIVVEISPDSEILDKLIADADIVQLEWWHHPLMAQWLSTKENIYSRLVVWSHTSGLHYPAIPDFFITLPHIFLFTTPVSLFKYNIRTVNTIDIVHSSGGFDDIPVLHRNFLKQSLKYGYTGTLNPAKLHPQIIDFINAVNIPDFCVDFYGDPSPQSPLELKNSNYSEIFRKICLQGFTNRLYDVLQEMDIFVYILNPLHYGTTENGLLEAMACGVVPVVLNNPVESFIVKDGETGILVDSPATFALAIKRLHGDPELRRKMSQAAITDIRTRFSIELTEWQLHNHYLKLLEKPKFCFNSYNIFGSTPWEWFSSCLGDYYDLFLPESTDSSRIKRLKLPILYEKSKSSVFQFKQYFPDDPLLKKWSEILEDDLASITIT